MGFLRRRDSAAAGAALALVVAANVAVLVGTHDPLKTAGAILLVLILPGAAVALAAGRDLDVAEVVLWVALSSIAVVILVGLVLDLLPGGLSERNWVIALDLVALAGFMVLWRRPPLLLGRRRPAASRARLLPAVVAIVALAIAAVAVVVTVQGARKADRAQAFVQLWAVPAGQHLQIGARNADTRGTGDYRIVLSRNGADFKQYAFRLPWGTDWQKEVTLPSSRATYVVVLYGSGGRALHRLRVTVPTPA